MPVGILWSYGYLSLSVVRALPSRDVNLAHENHASNNHGNGDDWEVDARKIETAHADVLASEDVPPEQARERSTEGGAESTVVDADRHAVNGGPEGAV